jgi:ribosomal protein S14
MTKLAENNPQGPANIADDRVLAPVYRYDIRCDKCGRFINSKEFKKKGGASECFVPDSEVSTEEISYRCKKCTKEHGMVKAFQSVRHNLTSWIH